MLLDGDRIVLRGDLQAQDEDQVVKFLGELPEGAYTIEASSMTLDPDAVSMWIRVVNQHLDERCSLEYANSQLAMIVEDDERYGRRSSSHP